METVVGTSRHDSLKTYRYLRIALVVLVVGLAASVVVEWLGTGPECLQVSISAYYYTPAQGMFVGALVAIGACLVILQGNTEWEDSLLNVAGMLAPVVAFVPTPYQENCYSAPVNADTQAANVANNIAALLVVAALGLAVAAVLGVRSRRPWTRLQRNGWLATVAAVSGTAALFHLDRSLFLDVGHYAAAVVMFGCIIVVVVLNALAYERVTHSRMDRNPYAVVAVLMVVLPLVMGGVHLAVGWEHVVLWVEATLILLFAVFWVVQTRELWGAGIRPAHAGPVDEGPTD
ncbi:MAG: hypothetical protein Q8Q44_18005 [Nocardioides sp.]|nr:hypothetical protein [Nocardioides sp.]